MCFLRETERPSDRNKGEDHAYERDRSGIAQDESQHRVDAGVVGGGLHSLAELREHLGTRRLDREGLVALVVSVCHELSGFKAFHRPVKIQRKMKKRANEIEGTKTARYRPLSLIEYPSFLLLVSSLNDLLITA